MKKSKISVKKNTRIRRLDNDGLVPINFLNCNNMENTLKSKSSAGDREISTSEENLKHHKNNIRFRIPLLLRKNRSRKNIKKDELTKPKTAVKVSADAVISISGNDYQYEKRKSLFKVPRLFNSKKSRENKNQTKIFPVIREWIYKKKFRFSRKKFKKFLQIDIDENKFPESDEIFGKDKNSVWINEKLYSFTGESNAEPEDSLDNVYDKDEYLKYIVWVEEEYERILALFKQKDQVTDEISYADRPKNDSKEMESCVNISNKNSFRIPFDDFEDELNDILKKFIEDLHN